jgi:hypothetical protein
LQWQGVQAREQAIQIIRSVWAEFEQVSIDALVASFPNRVEMVREAEGRTIQPLISAGKTQVPPGYAMAIRVPAEWDNASDALLESLVQRIERRWKIIAIMIIDFTEGECKNRWMILINLKCLKESWITFTGIKGLCHLFETCS